MKSNATNNDFSSNGKSPESEMKHYMLNVLAQHEANYQLPEVADANWQKFVQLKNRLEDNRKKIFQALRARWVLRQCQLQGFPRVSGKVRIGNLGGTIRVGQKVLFDSKLIPSEFAVGHGGLLEIGARTYINYGVSIAAKKLIWIGEDCLIGTFVNIMDDDFHGIEDRAQPPPSQPVILENNVWLGARVVVLKGVTIGHDSVIGAGSVVTKSIPPRSVAVGLPARVIKTF